ncbi:hypothetical protein HYV70_04240 [Candidatus Uhrbacteria bacterium]|nr:hypothetical protein [Candidatus Uhrbacteria bacterium]
MSELRTHQDGIRAGEEAIRTYSKQREELRTEQGVVRKSLAEVHQKLETARQDLTLGYLSSFDRESVDRATNELGMMSLPVLFGELIRERQGKQQRLQVIEGSDRFSRKEVSFQEDGQTIAELRGRLASLAEEREHLNQNLEFMALYKRRTDPVLAQAAVPAEEARAVAGVYQYEQEIQGHEMSLDHLNDQRARFEKNAEFVALVKRQDQEPFGWFWGFLRTVLLFGLIVDGLRRRREKELLRSFSKVSFSDVVVEYEQIKSEGEEVTRLKECASVHLHESRRVIDDAALLRRIHDMFGASFFEVAERYDRLVSEESVVRTSVEEVAKKQENLRSLVQEYDELCVELQTFDAKALDRLRQALSRHLESCEGFDEIRKGVSVSAKLTVTTIIALKEKAKYFQGMLDALGREIVDREKRMCGVEKVLPKWRKKPYNSLKNPAAKTKWLVKGPQQKTVTTHQYVSRVHVMHTNVYTYGDYTALDYLLDRTTDILIYDMFARAAEERMPSEAFACQIIPEIGSYREEYGPADRAYYAQIDGAVEHQFDDTSAQDAALAASADLASQTDTGTALDENLDSEDPTTESEPDGSFEDVS